MAIGAERDWSGFRRRLKLALTMMSVALPRVVQSAVPSTGSDDETVLPQVVVQATAERADPDAHPGGQVARRGGLGILGNADLMAVPFNITSYTAKLLQDQQARSIADVLANNPSAQLASARTNIGEDFALRGFPMASQDVALNGMYGLMPYFRVPIEMAERVEVIEGPVAMLNGIPPSGDIGGAVNVVTKRAGATPLAEVSVDYLSDLIYGGHVDLGRRFGEGRVFGARFNGAFRDGATTIDRESLQEGVGSLNLDYSGEQLKLSADVIFQREKIDRVVRQFTGGPTLTSIPRAPDNALNYPGYGYSIMKDTTWVVHGDYDLNDSIAAYAGYGERRSRMNAVAGNPVLLDGAGDFTSTPAWQLYNVDSSSAEAGVRAAFRTGPTGHRVAVGFTRVVQNADIYFLFDAFAPRSSNLYRPVLSDTPSTAGYRGHPLPYTGTELVSYAVADTLSAFADRLEVTAGVRHQQVKARNYAIGTGAPSGAPYDESAVTPSVGIVYRPIEAVSLYANYIEGLSQGPTAPLGTTNSGEAFAPYKSRQEEIGVKTTWSRLTTTLSAFTIKRPSGITRDNTFALNGEQINRGVELNVFGEPTSSVRLLGGGAYYRARLEKTQNGQFDGNHAVGVPDVQINLGGEWDVGFAPGLTLTARVVHTGKQYFDQANTLVVPEWTRTDLGARYRFSVFDEPIVARLNVDNVFDADYWGASPNGYLFLGAARTLHLSVTASF